MVLENYAKEVDRFLNVFFKKEREKISLNSSPDFGMLEKVEDFCLRGGKRLRPALVYFGYLLKGRGRTEEIIKTSIVMELVHAYLLIHDDFMDESGTRRGRPTVHKYYEKEFEGLNKSPEQLRHLSNSLAVLAGDLAQCLWLQILGESSFPDSLKVDIVSRINQSVRTTIQGQELDLRFEAKRFVASAEILEMYKLKTAQYTFECPLHVGLVLSGADRNEFEIISKYALPLGIAFQIKDDILGLFGDETKTGKSVLDDLERGKQTILVAKALELSSLQDRQLLESRIGQPGLKKKEAEEIKRIIKDSGSLLFAQNLMQEQAEKSKEAARMMRERGYNAEAVDFLENLVAFIVERES